MGSPINIIGERYGRLIVLSLYKKTDKHTWFKCICDCGNTSIVIQNNIRKGTTQSCGCLQSERASIANWKHGENGSSEYNTWSSIKDRCYNKNNDRYADWGGRGIRVCERWLDENDGFKNFLFDMGRKPSPSHSIDRFPNNEGDYEPTNCRWATVPQQNRNKRSNIWIEYDGKKMILADWATYFGVTYSTLKEHLSKKDISDVVKFYKNKKTGRKLSDSDVVEIRRRVIDGEYQSDLAKIFKVSHGLINSIVNYKIYK